MSLFWPLPAAGRVPHACTPGHHRHATALNAEAACWERRVGWGRPAQSYNNIGLVLQTMGRLVEAKPYFEKAVSSYERSLGEEHPLLACLQKASYV